MSYLLNPICSCFGIKNKVSPVSAVADNKNIAADTNSNGNNSNGGTLKTHDFASGEELTKRKPSLRPISKDEALLSSMQVDIDNVIQRLLEVGRQRDKLTRYLVIKNYEILAICRIVAEIFMRQPMLLELQPPVKIVGDIHGQYLDLIHIFDTCGYPDTENYLLLGDYVDRGKQSLETILLLFCYKIKFPDRFYILRGNHECSSINRVYGFFDECKRRCNIKCWRSFTDVFNTLPVAALVANKIFCVHGGLSPGLHSLKQISNLNRPTDIPDFGLLNDLLWSDPSDSVLEWEENDRGVSYLFGKFVLNQFLQRHDLDLVCRAHTVVEEGYEFFNDRTLVTVFSAPNYCGEFDNLGAVLIVDADLVCSFQIIKQVHNLYKIE